MVESLTSSRGQSKYDLRVTAGLTALCGPQFTRKAPVLGAGCWATAGVSMGSAITRQCLHADSTPLALIVLMLALGAAPSHALAQSKAAASTITQRAVLETRLSQAASELNINRAARRRVDLTSDQQQTLAQRGRALELEVSSLRERLRSL